MSNTLGRYHIIREIARSNDIVYEAMDPARGCRIALKELQIPGNLAGAARQERIERFTREARAAAGLQHPNIVRILDHGNHQGRYYIAMEFLQGQSLRDLLRQRGALPAQEALRIAAAVAEGLDYAHKRGVVHRDVKPDNVHLEPDGRVVITDFGIARLTFEASLTAAGQIFGTPSYMSPEQITGKQLDHRTDLFSLGVMVYEMLSGRKPFTGDSVITITYNIMNSEPPPLAAGPPGAETVVRHAMAKDPAVRYSSAAQLAEDLRLIGRGAPPRHAAPVPSRSAVAAPPAPAPRSTAPRPAAGPPMGARPAPPPLPPTHAAPAVGAAMPRPRPPIGPPVGARPLPRMGTAAPPLPAPAAPRPAPSAAVRRPRAIAGGGNTTAILGWIGVAVIVAVLILSVVWASVTASDRFRSGAGQSELVRLHEVAVQAQNAGKLEDALASYRKVVEGAEGDLGHTARVNAARAAALLAENRVEEGKVTEAIELSEEALELHPEEPLAYVAKGRALAKDGRIDDAVSALDEAPRAADRLSRGEYDRDYLRTAREDAANARRVKVKVLYEAAEQVAASSPTVAIQRYEQVIATLPASAEARNAVIRIRELRAGGGLLPGGSGPAGPLQFPAGSLPNPLKDGAPQLPAGARPPGWDDSYKNLSPD
ncbi:MAG: protein kinase domain-containing protein [Armatimonadota bacterium]